MRTHSEAERAVLGALLIAPEWVQPVSAILRADDFSEPKHRLIFRACLGLSRDGLDIDLRTVQHRLIRGGDLEKAGGVSYLAGLDSDLPEVSRVEIYSTMVRDLADAKRVAGALRSGLDELQAEGDMDVTSTWARVRSAVDGIEAGRQVGDNATMRDVMTAAVANVELRRQSGRAVGGLRTGFAGLDSWTDGLEAGQLVILAARPGMGKSALAGCIALNTSRAGRPTQLFLLEMSTMEWGHRMIANLGRVPLSRVRAGHLTSDELDRIRAHRDASAGWPLYIDETARRTVPQMAAQSRRLAHRLPAPLACIIVDYLHLVSSEHHAGESTNDRISGIARSLKTLAKDMKVPVLAISQLSRALEARPPAERRPFLSDLRDSGALEQDADMVLFLYRDSVYNKSADPEMAELIIAKQRQGKTGTVHLRWAPEFQLFSGA